MGRELEKLAKTKWRSIMSSDKQLREDVLKLAQENPELRRHLLPLLRKQAVSGADPDLDAAGIEKQTKDILHALKMLSHHKIKPKVEREPDGSYAVISFNAPVSMAAAYVEAHLNDMLGKRTPFWVEPGGPKVYIEVGIDERRRR